ncbi:MAG TPA: septal ring lytic transglycosylase RlpA family protein [Williamwhitmania sp.]|nr:septal ring lytic transglycosylase RlpA family protein [Williamwhitmania sp.]
MHRLLLLCATGLMVTLGTRGQPAFVQEGNASYYGSGFHGKRTASGEVFSKNKLTAAHPTLEFGTLVKVTNLTNGKSVVVRINDRGPFSKNRIIDLSEAAAKRLDMVDAGTAMVRVETVTQQPTDTTTKATPSGEGYEFFDVEVTPAKHTGWAVQIGSFGEAANFIRLADHVKQRYNQHLLVQVVTVKERQVYRVLVGELPTEEKAKELLLALKREYPDAFITKLN